MGQLGTYTLFDRPGERANTAGMMPLGPHMKGASSHWLAYFAVGGVSSR